MERNRYEEYIKNEYGIPFVSFEGLNIDVIHELVLALDKIFLKFPALQKAICEISNLEQLNAHVNLLMNYKLNYNKLKWNDYVEADEEEMLIYSQGYNFFTRKIEYIAVGYGGKISNKSLKTINKRLKKQAEKMYHPKHCRSIEFMLYHEIGHILEQILNLAQDRYLRYLIASKTEGFSKMYVVGQISQYALESIEELIADAFAEYMMYPRSNELIYIIGRYIELKYQKYEDKKIFEINHKYGSNLIKSSDVSKLRFIQKDFT